MDELMQDLTVTANDYAGRDGLDENFLGQHVPLPGLAGAETVGLPYTHFSVLMRLDKRLAGVTGVGIDGEKTYGPGPRWNQLAAGSAASRGSSRRGSVAATAQPRQAPVR
jgi:DNA/RNA endonuclease G (NUC1)